MSRPVCVSHGLAITLTLPGRARAHVRRMIDVDGRTTLEPRDAVILVVHFDDAANPHAVEFVQVTPDAAPYVAGTVH